MPFPKHHFGKIHFRPHQVTVRWVPGSQGQYAGTQPCNSMVMGIAPEGPISQSYLGGIRIIKTTNPEVEHEQ